MFSIWPSNWEQPKPKWLSDSRTSIPKPIVPDIPKIKIPLISVESPAPNNGHLSDRVLREELKPGEEMDTADVDQMLKDIHVGIK